MVLKFLKKLLYVARNIKSNVRELEGAISLIAQSLSIKEVTIELAKVWLKIREECKTKISIDYIQKTV
jgi:chromosomal replication initiation ATPase DnaA